MSFALAYKATILHSEQEISLKKVVVKLLL